MGAEELKKVNVDQTLIRVVLMTQGDDGSYVPVRTSAETGGTIGGGGGTITGVVAGDGLTGGGTSGSVTLNVNVDNVTLEINTDALRVKDGGITNAKLGNESVDYDNLSVGARASVARKNGIINGAFPVWQRGTSSPTTTNNTYGPDRWRLLLGAANAATIARTTDAPTTSKYACALTVGSGNNNKFGIFQPLEGIDTYRYRNKTVTLSAQLKATTGLSDIRMAIMQWTSTEDGVSSSPISTWNATATNPTLAANWAYCNTPANLSVGTSYANFSVSGAVTSSTTNLGIFIWNDDTSTTTTTDVLKIGEVQVEVGDTATPFEQLHQQQTLELCQRYCFVPSGSGANSPFIGIGIIATLVVGASEAYVALSLPTTMRARPTLTVTPSQWLLVDVITNPAASAISVSATSSPDLVRLNCVANGTFADVGETVLLMGDGTGARVMVFDAEL